MSQSVASPTSLPRISIITPSYNQAAYVEQTIRSVLDQNYPNLEYLVIDGGSTDGSVDIIRKYADRLAYWVSEKDRGQTHAINKGRERLTGDVIAYLNSDDYYLPGTLDRVGRHFAENPDTDLLHGICRNVNNTGEKIGQQLGDITRYDEILDLWDIWWKGRQFTQPEVFWSRRISDRVGPFREDLHFVMDYEYWARILKAGGKVRRIDDQEFTCFRFTPGQKSERAEEVSDELLKVVGPLLWERHPALSWRRKKELQGKWLYDAVIRKAALRSSVAGESRLMRWLKLSGLSLRHPQLLLSANFRHRLTGRLST